MWAPDLKRLRRSFLGLALVLPIAAGCAQNAASRGGGAAETMLSESESAQRQVDRERERLDRLLKDLNVSLSGDSRLRLASLQQQWDAFVRQDCEWRKSLAGSGSAAPLTYAHCVHKHIAGRIESLKILLCEGGGMTGACAASAKY